MTTPRIADGTQKVPVVVFDLVMPTSYYVYVIRLKDDVLGSRKFRDANPGRDSRMPCVYVGSSVRLPDDRLRQHKRGYRSNAFVRAYGEELLPDLYEKYNPIPSREDAEELERYLTNRLRRMGYAVWSH
jgi:hypothetical protein